jgi:hypothetical protein
MKIVYRVVPAGIAFYYLTGSGFIEIFLNYGKRGHQELTTSFE